MGVVSGSVDWEASAVTPSGALPEVGLTVSAALGGESLTETTAVALDDSSALSVTVTFTV